MAITFRRATNADLPAVHPLVDGALRAYGLSLVLEAGDIDLSDVDRYYDARGGQLELLETGDRELVGVVGWRPAPMPGRVIELKKLYVAGTARGQGLGRQALMRVIEVARGRGARAIVLETAAVLREANALYRKLGFVPVQGEAAGPFVALTEQCDMAYRLELT